MVVRYVMLIDKEKYYVVPYVKFKKVLYRIFREFDKDCHLIRYGYVDKKEDYLKIKGDFVVYDLNAILVKESDDGFKLLSLTDLPNYTDFVAVPKDRIKNYLDYITLFGDRDTQARNFDFLKSQFSCIMEEVIVDEQKENIRKIKQAIKTIENRIRHDKIKLNDLKTELYLIENNEK